MFVPRKQIKVALKTWMCTTVVAETTVDYFTERRCSSQCSTSHMPQQFASFAGRVSHPGRCLSWLPIQCCQFHNWSLEFAFLHGTIDALVLAKATVLLCFQRNPLPGIVYSTWESNQAVAENCRCIKSHVLWLFGFWKEKFHIKRFNEESEGR